jgi:hypothetical protein
MCSRQGLDNDLSTARCNETLACLQHVIGGVAALRKPHCAVQADNRVTLSGMKTRQLAFL